MFSPKQDSFRLGENDYFYKIDTINDVTVLTLIKIIEDESPDDKPERDYNADNRLMSDM